jgi:hypothetical protein
MIDAFLQPMFDSRVTFLGLPLTLVLVAVAFVILAGGFAWMRRISQADPEPRSFRATTRPDPIDRLVRGVILAGVAFAAVYALVAVAT